MVSVEHRLQRTQPLPHLFSGLRQSPRSLSHPIPMLPQLSPTWNTGHSQGAYRVEGCTILHLAPISNSSVHLTEHQTQERLCKSHADAQTQLGTITAPCPSLDSSSDTHRCRNCTTSLLGFIYSSLPVWPANASKHFLTCAAHSSGNASPMGPKTLLLSSTCVQAAVTHCSLPELAGEVNGLKANTTKKPRRLCGE